jgi:hypothetical protein
MSAQGKKISNSKTPRSHCIQNQIKKKTQSWVVYNPTPPKTSQSQETVVEDVYDGRIDAAKT